MLNTLKKLILKGEQDIGGIRKNSEKWESLFFFFLKIGEIWAYFHGKEKFAWGSPSFPVQVSTMPPFL